MTDSSLNFIFKVLNFFSFSDGSTVFCGEVKSEVKQIPLGKYHLFVDDVEVQTLNITSEFIPKKLSAHTERSINTFDTVNISKDLLGKKEIKLISSRRLG